jgi:RNA polymerase sigma factor (sigma-70 family)
MNAGLRALSRPIWGGCSKPALSRIRPQRFAGENGKERPKATVDWAELIGRVAIHSDRDAFKLLFEHFAPRVKGFLVKTGMAADAAEEIAQNTLLTVWRKAAQFDPSSAGAAAWIFTIARNLRIDSVRRSARQARVSQPALEDVPEVVESPETTLTRHDDVSRVAAALLRLSEEQSTVIRMSFIEERPHADIASALGIPLGTVKSRIRLAMMRLRNLLEEPT